MHMVLKKKKKKSQKVCETESPSHPSPSSPPKDNYCLSPPSVGLLCTCKHTRVFYTNYPLLHTHTQWQLQNCY